MSISIEGSPGSGKSLFARFLSDKHGITVHGLHDDIDVNSDDLLNDSSLRCIMTCRKTDRTVRYLIEREPTRDTFRIKKLVYRNSNYHLRWIKRFKFNPKKKTFKPIPILDYKDFLFIGLMLTFAAYIIFS